MTPFSNGWKINGGRIGVVFGETLCLPARRPASQSLVRRAGAPACAKPPLRRAQVGRRRQGATFRSEFLTLNRFQIVPGVRCVRGLSTLNIRRAGVRRGPHRFIRHSRRKGYRCLILARQKTVGVPEAGDLWLVRMSINEKTDEGQFGYRGRMLGAAPSNVSTQRTR